MKATGQQIFQAPLMEEQNAIAMRNKLFMRRTPEEFKELSRRVVYRHPVRTAILSQISFWLIANTLLIFTIWLTIFRASYIYPVIVPPPLHLMLLAATIAAIIYGTVLGAVDLLLERWLSRDLQMGVRILFKSLIYTLVLLGIMIMVTGTLQALVGEKWAHEHGLVADARTRMGFLTVMAPFAFVGNLLMSAFKQIDASFGPGVLPALLLGRYRRPVQERRVFMFMDLRSSTSYAERLGHQRYSSMIRDLFSAMDETVRRFDAEVYQYVGDEVVFTWNATVGTHDHRCLLFFLAIEDAILARRGHFEQEYGLLPEFKAGLHLGEVTTVEIGTIKREIAYHGDAINTAARIQGLCNGMGRTMLISDDVLAACGKLGDTPVQIEDLGSVQLRGKLAPTVLHAVHRQAA